MKDAAYWKERAEVLEEVRHGEAEAYAAQLATEYDRYTAHTKAEIEKWYQRLADNNDLSLAGAHKLLKDDELVEFHWTVEEYIERGRQNAVDQRWMKQLENASAKVHVSRLEAARTEMQQQVEMLSAGQERGMTRLLSGVYKDAYGQTAFEIQKGVGVGFGINGIDARAVADVIRKPWTTDRRSFSDRIWTNKVELLARLQTDLTQAVMRGDNPKVLAAGIAQKFGVAKHKAERLVLTETAYFNAQGQKDAYKEMDVEAVVFVATLDGRTSDVCRSMDGQIIAMKDYEPGVTVPPLHPFCRSTTAPWFDDDFTEVEFRASRDAAGKTVYEVPADMTYPEWEEKFVVGKKAPPDSSTDAGVAMDPAMTLKLEEKDDLQALDKELVDKNVAQVKSLHAIYFGERQTAETFSIDSKTSAGNLAEYAPARHSAKPSEGNVRIGLNKAYYLDRKALIEKELMLRDSGFSMPFSDEKADVYSIAHEFGHHVADVLIKDRRDWKSFDQMMQKASMDKNISRARKRIQSFVDNEQKALNSEIYAIAKQSNSGILIREQLSRYGRTKPSEAFAEMFANANCGRPNALGSALLKFMESR